MKKSIVISLLFMGLGLASCKKDYECTCTYPGLKDPDVSPIKMKEEDAKSYCNSLNDEYALQSGSCYLSVK